MREEVSQERGTEQQPGNDLHTRSPVRRGVDATRAGPTRAAYRLFLRLPAKIEKKERCYARVKGLKLAIAATSSAASIGLEMCI